MVWYVRVLSVPKLELQLPRQSNPSGSRRNIITGNLVASFPIQLANDLSEQFYPESATFRVQLIERDLSGNEFPLSTAQTIPWTWGYCRVEKARVSFPVGSEGYHVLSDRPGVFDIAQSVLLHFSVVTAGPATAPATDLPATTIWDVAEFQELWTAPYHIRSGNAGGQVIAFEVQDGPWLQRRVSFPEPVYLEDGVNITPPNEGSEERNPMDEFTEFAAKPVPQLLLWEDSGVSIARHVWDGGIALAAHFAKIIHQPQGSMLGELLLASSILVAHEKPPATLRVLELGAGVGTAGLALAHLLPNSAVSIVLTDVREAQEILKHNTLGYYQSVVAPFGPLASVVRCELDWADVATDAADAADVLAARIAAEQGRTAPASAGIALAVRPRGGRASTGRSRGTSTRGRGATSARGRGRGAAAAESSHGSTPAQSAGPARDPFDLIVVSDCTYNEATLEMLVLTLVAAKQYGQPSAAAMSSVPERPSPLVVVARKPRHASEEQFFPMMRAHGFQQLEETRVRLPDAARVRLGSVEEYVEVFVYG